MGNFATFQYNKGEQDALIIDNNIVKIDIKRKWFGTDSKFSLIIDIKVVIVVLGSGPPMGY